MLELLCSGQIIDFKELSSNESDIKHLRSYGIIGTSGNNFDINIPVIGRYVAQEMAKTEKRSFLYKIIESEKRESWLNRRIEEIVCDIRILEKVIRDLNSHSLFGINSFPEADDFCRASICNNKDSFSNFMNLLSRCFVESIEAFGRSINKNKYFWEEIKSTYPDLWEVLQRIKVYRNERDHLELNTSNNSKFLEYISDDFEGKLFSSVPDPYFVIQQRILDRLLLSIQIELEKLS
jgi:hypothetical protein